MAEIEMVRLLTTLDQFEARVLAARLGAEGVLWELRGGHDGPYPMGPVHVFVEAADLERAQELVASTEALPVEVDE
jgi:Putative prokaryotic signal transducing protein